MICLLCNEAAIQTCISAFPTTSCSVLRMQGTVDPQLCKPLRKSRFQTTDQTHSWTSICILTSISHVRIDQIHIWCPYSRISTISPLKVLSCPPHTFMLPLSNFLIILRSWGCVSTCTFKRFFELQHKLYITIEQKMIALNQKNDEQGTSATNLNNYLRFIFVRIAQLRILSSSDCIAENHS